VSIVLLMRPEQNALCWRAPHAAQQAPFLQWLGTTRQSAVPPYRIAWRENMRDSRAATTALTGHPPHSRSAVGPGAPVPPTLIFVAGLGAGWWLEGAIPSVGSARLAILGLWGWILSAVGLALFVWGLATFAKAGTGIMLQQAATEVVARGPYHWSRNPQYVAFILMYVGVSLIAGLMWSLLLLPLVIVGVSRLVISREERYLRATFGPAYGQYCERVSRWV
jgi:protein-S-isoprenylcysteine O-methyltransferase Ste14